MPRPSGVLLSDAPIVFGDPQLHTDGDVVGLAFAKDGSLWSVEEPGVVRQWNALTGQLLSHQQLSDMETLWGFSDDGRLIAAAADDLAVWDAAAGHLLGAMPQPSWVTAMAFAGERGIVATGHDDGSVQIWDASAQMRLCQFSPHRRAISAVTFSPDGKKLASAGENKTIFISRLDDGKTVLTLKGHTDRIPRLLWHPDGRWLISAGWDATARVWDSLSGEVVILLNTHKEQVTALAVSPDGRLLATADAAGEVHLWSCPSIKRLHVFSASAAEIRCLAFTPDSKLLASAGADQRINLWEIESGQPLSVASTLPQASTSIAISTDGSRLIANNGGGCRIWDTLTREPVLTLADKESIAAVAGSPDGRWIAGASGVVVHLWNVRTGKLHASLPEHDAPINVLAFAPDSRLSAASSQGMSVWIWDIKQAKPMLLIPDALDGCAIHALAFQPPIKNQKSKIDQRSALLAVGGIDWMATSGSDGGLCLWDVDQRCEVANFGGGTTALAFHPSGDRLVAATLDYSLVVWDIASGEMIAELNGHDGSINCVAFSPDSSVLASGSDDRTVRLWNLDAGAEIAVKELDSQVKALCYSPDGRHLFTGNGNSTCYKMRGR
jgi:WD40 repeat protein